MHNVCSDFQVEAFTAFRLAPSIGGLLVFYNFTMLSVLKLLQTYVATNIAALNGSKLNFSISYSLMSFASLSLFAVPSDGE